MPSDDPKTTKIGYLRNNKEIPKLYKKSVLTESTEHEDVWRFGVELVNIGIPYTMSQIGKSGRNLILKDVADLLSKDIMAASDFAYMLKHAPDAYNYLLKELGLKKSLK